MPKIKYLILLSLLFLWSQASSQTSTYTSDVSEIIDGKSPIRMRQLHVVAIFAFLILSCKSNNTNGELIGL